MDYKEIIEEIKKNKFLVGIKVIYNDKDYTIYKKNAIYNIYQKNNVDGLIRCIKSNVDYKILKYEGIYNINELHY